MRQLCNGVQRNIASQQIFRTCVKLRQAHDISLRITISSRFLGLWPWLPWCCPRVVSTRDRRLADGIFNEFRREFFCRICSAVLKLCQNMTKSRPNRRAPNCERWRVKPARNHATAPAKSLPSWCEGVLCDSNAIGNAAAGSEHHNGRDRAIAAFAECLDGHAGSRTRFLPPQEMKFGFAKSKSAAAPVLP